MADMLNVYNLSLRKTAVLQDAFDIVETKTLNQIYTLRFSLPEEDLKAQYCLPRHYVRYGDKGELYRIIKPTYSEDNVKIVTYDCEHVITTLCDNVMFGSYTYGGGSIKTAEVIKWVLSKQKAVHWKLGVCDFDRKFEYGWEQENLLNAIYSIPKEFAQPYQWTFDTTSHPWTINLRKIDTTQKPQYYLRAKKNILSAGSSEDYSEVCTRIYPLGYGEGVNQLGITEATVNAQGDADPNGKRYGKTYIESPANIVAQYGIIEKVLVDRRFEHPNTLYAYAKTMLEAYQTPGVSRRFDVTDLHQLTHDPIDQAEVGYICKLTGDGTITYITKTQRQLDLAGDLHIDISTKPTDVATSIADLADRVRIESVYAQGATQLYQHSKDANATPTKGMVMSLYFPSEMRQINKVLLRLKLNKFRSYSQATDAADITIATNPVALENLDTTEAGGGTTASGGGTSVTVSGGSVSAQNTGARTVSMNVSAKAVTALPQETATSQPSIDVTSGTIWAGDNNMTTTESTTNGVVSLYGVFDGNKLYGGTYSLYSDDDGRHSHSFFGGYGEITVTGGGHSHNVSVNVPVNNTIPVKNNLTSNNQGRHAHNITFNALAHNHKIPHYHTVNISGTASGGSHTHSFSIPDHTHTITAHKHKLPNLSHKHNITFKGHSHKITAGIFESGNPTAFDIYIGSKKVTTVNSRSFDGDITSWLLDSKNQVPRGTWIDVEIRPNDLAYVVSSVFVQGFVQSRGGGNY